MTAHDRGEFQTRCGNCSKINIDIQCKGAKDVPLPAVLLIPFEGQLLDADSAPLLELQVLFFPITPLSIRSPSMVREEA